MAAATPAVGTAMETARQRAVADLAAVLGEGWAAGRALEGWAQGVEAAMGRGRKATAAAAEVAPHSVADEWAAAAAARGRATTAEEDLAGVAAVERARQVTALAVAAGSAQGWATEWQEAARREEAMALAPTGVGAAVGRGRDFRKGEAAGRARG